jgi:hypothetical protein
MTKGDHPELDNSPPCGLDDTAKFQGLVGALQWTISLCRVDIAHAAMTLSRHRAQPLVGPTKVRLGKNAARLPAKPGGEDLCKRGKVSWKHTHVHPHSRRDETANHWSSLDPARTHLGRGNFSSDSEATHEATAR